MQLGCPHRQVKGADSAVAIDPKGILRQGALAGDLAQIDAVDLHPRQWLIDGYSEVGGRKAGVNGDGAPLRCPTPACR